MTDHKIMEFVSAELLHSIADAGLQTVIRRALFNPNNKIDWQDLYADVLHQMPEYARPSEQQRLEEVYSNSRSFTVKPKQDVKASSLGSYVGGRLLTDWTASLLVYGAEGSDDYDYERSFDGPLNDCLIKLKEYQSIIKSNNIDGYLTLEANNSGEYFEGDYSQIYDDLRMRGLV